MDLPIETKPMPLLFLGHGNPMNAIEENEFVQGFRTVATTLPKPQAILCISAHWETRGTFVTAMEKPRTIHDFGGFPKALYEVDYPAPGSPEWALEIKSTVKSASIGLDMDWGLDHGTWSVIKHLYPKADIPVLQCSLDRLKTPLEQYHLAKEFTRLRQQGVLIVGSGNMVHNLRMVDWSKPEDGFDWAERANEMFKQLITDNNHQALLNYHNLGNDVARSIPTPEHYLPLMYILALKQESETCRFFNDKLVMGSLSMTSLIVE